MPILIDIFLLALLAITAVAIVRVRNLFAVVLLAGIYSLLSAGLFTTMDAMDVAFTEAAVGAGISTVLLLGTLLLVGIEEARPRHTRILPLAVTVVTGAMLVYGTLDLPTFGAAENPAHHHVAPRYVHESPREVAVPNLVTAVLASYRGYDTMGETTVVFAAVVGILALLVGAGGGKGTASPRGTRKVTGGRRREGDGGGRSQGAGPRGEGGGA